MKYQKFSHKTPHLKGKQHQLDPNLDLKQLVHHSTVQYVDRDADGDVDVYDNQKLLEKIVNQIYKEKIPLLPCYSKSGGLHLYLFTSIKIEYSEIKNALEYFKKKLNENSSYIGE